MKRNSLRIGIVLSIAFAMPSASHACLWDYDTLKQERARFPDTLEIITGKFLRHSREFYQWRIEDRLKKIPADPKNPALYDDLAVAYEKTGQNAKAVETMLKVEKFAPGRYETYSNLGTFYFLGGDFKKGLEYVNKALAINPDAHFGREKYQKYLTEYVIERSKDGKIVLPLSRLPDKDGRFSGTFSVFLATKLDPEHKEISKEQRQAAVKGVLGMMRFAYHDAPVLLEVLGDLLFKTFDPPTDAKRLAARAYLQASYRVDHLEAKAEYRALAQRSLSMQTKNENTTDEITLEEIEKEFQAELDDARRWYSELEAKEQGWIGGGVNPETEFDKLYAEEPRVPGEIAESDAFPEGPRNRRATVFWYAEIIGICVLAAILLALISILVYRRSRSRLGDRNP